MGLVVPDASALIAFLRQADAHHVAAVDTLGSLRREHRFAVPSVTYAELLVEPIRRGEAAAQRLRRFVTDLAIEIVPVDRALAEAAATVRARRTSIRMPDALVLALAEAREAVCVVTADRRWGKQAVPVVVLGS
jgi:predicted nucleic acid-binding protein